ncbi:MAG: LysM peptidoglycan-binding domain-containing protein [Opitutaceae bacterium]
MNAPSLLLVSGFCLPGSLAAGAPVLSGIMILPEGPRFCLVEEETEADAPPEWHAVGSTFNDYKLMAFDPELEVLTLQRGNEVTMLKLRKATIEALDSAAAPGAEAAVFTVDDLRDLSNEQLHARGLHRIEEGDTLSSIAMRTRVPLRRIMDANEGIDPRKLEIGRILSLRPGRPAPDSAPTTVAKEAAESRPPETPETPVEAPRSPPQ